MNKLAIPATKDELRLFLRLMMNQKKKKKLKKRKGLSEKHNIKIF